MYNYFNTNTTSCPIIDHLLSIKLYIYIFNIIEVKTNGR